MYRPARLGIVSWAPLKGLEIRVLNLVANLLYEYLTKHGAGIFRKIYGG